MSPRRALSALALCPLALVAPPVASAAIGAKQVGKFNRPVYVHGPEGAGGALFVVERAGRIKVVG